MKNSIADTRAAAYRTGFCERLLWVRKLKERSQIAVAANLGLQPVTWGRYETGIREISLHNLAAFCTVYDVDPRWLILGDIYALPKDLRLRLLKAFPEASKYLIEPSGGDGSEQGPAPAAASAGPPTGSPAPGPRLPAIARTP